VSSGPHAKSIQAGRTGLPCHSLRPVEPASRQDPLHPPFGDSNIVSNASVEDRVKKIVCDQMGTTADKINLGTSFINDLGADSLDTVELVMEFEDEFEISIPDEDAEKIQTVGAAVTYIQDKLS
jgi:acyl carrier protein